MFKPVCILMVLVTFVVNLVGASARADVWPSGREAVELEAHPFDLADVRLLDGPFRDAMLRTQRYLHSLESDRLLWYFRQTAGLDTAGEPMGGWERTEVRGHSLGHYLSGCALLVASTGDATLKDKADAIVAELAKCQKAIGTGYLSAYPEEQIDRVLACKPVWAPWYTLHKIYAGLIDMYVHCDNKQALEIAQGMAQWAKGRLDEFDREAMQKILDHTEQGGMNETLANLYGVTGERTWLELAERFNQDHYNDSLALHQDKLTGEHVNSFIPNIIGTARQYELTGDLTDRHLAEFFWNCVVHGRTYCTGGTSNHEAWRTPPYRLADQLSVESQESCCSYNMLKLTRHLFTWRPDAAYGDYYERTLINSILATQDRRSGMCMYYVSMEPGHWKVFHTPRDSFWCCTGTGMENHAKYGDSIYFHNADTLWVNLFIASELNWKDKGVRVRQDTEFPEVGATTLTVEVAQPTRFELRLRVPSWARQGVTLKINGRRQVVTAQPGSFLSIRRRWKETTQVELTMPMSLWLWPMPDDANLAAIMYGPLVLAGQLGDEGLSRDMIIIKNQREQDDGPNVEAPALLVDSKADVGEWLKPVPNKSLTFRTVGVGRPDDVTLVPFHELFDQRYTLYWRLVDEAGWERIQMDRKAREAAQAEAAARRAAQKAREIDAIDIGASGSEQSHAMKGENTQSGSFRSWRWRHADAGWFEYRLAVLPDEPTTLLCTYWGSDEGRAFDILIDGKKIATQTLTQNQPDAFFEVEYAIPAELTQGKKNVVVRFVAHSDSTAGGLFGCATLKPAP